MRKWVAFLEHADDFEERHVRAFTLGGAKRQIARQGAAGARRVTIMPMRWAPIQLNSPDHFDDRTLRPRSHPLRGLVIAVDAVLDRVFTKRAVRFHRRDPVFPRRKPLTGK